jgi:valyl-tRNA synthetase
VDGAHRERQERKLSNLNGRITALEEKLNNPGFTGKAPGELVQQTRALLDQLRLERDRLSGSV